MKRSAMRAIKDGEKACGSLEISHPWREFLQASTELTAEWQSRCSMQCQRSKELCVEPFTR